MSEESKKQSEEDRAIIRVKLIENAVLVGAGAGWHSFADWPDASSYIERRIASLKEKRAAA